MSGDLIDTTEMYLRTVLELEEEGITPMRARIVERLHHSGPTVSQTVSRMERDGLLSVAPDRALQLTPAGRATAVSVMRKHRLAERLLSDVVGLDMAHVHEEACRWEHVMSERVEQRLVELLGNPEESPYGTPIPGRDDGDGTPQVFGGLTLQDVASFPQPGEYEVRLLPEVVQADPELIEMLSSAGILTGARVTAEANPGDEQRVLVTNVATGVSLDLDAATARAVRVLAAGD
ncbi:DtxR family transcriptional regulator [Kocuria tytonicola]|uniref:Metal-dependent transcriptional regulator n=1 Tax=Kocuria tytonicola TaxID=2055946 RepID=A0A3L9L0M6_9MICC|nr:metal-dependent transcriptional regulator [Kocuria tytonicola]RLY92185.1 metal-dependent transcriptional regulator [Kocuria tytonicola]RLZ03893.1 DtxR family transcriptional regulator [Kocuria tytonicola]